MRRAPALAALALACFLSLPGCDDNMWLEYHDDPYIVNLAQQGEQEVLRHVNSMNKDERQMALRILANQAAEKRRKGYRADADRLDKIIIRRYFIEKETEVRACIVRICAPASGRGSTEMVTFLRERIAAGEFPGYAALSMASLAPREAFSDIEPLTRHPAHEVRLQAAVALTVLGDPRGYDAVIRVWRNMNGAAWPDRIDGTLLDEARKNLEMRAFRAFGRPLA